jgi:serine/threonine-protein kinase
VNKVITSPPEPLCEFKIMSDEDPPKPVEGGSPPIPEELVKICQTAMARAIEDRFASAELLSAEVTAWIDGAHRREKALGEVARAHELSSQIQHLRGEAETLMARATEALRAIEVWRPEENKVALWADQDRAMALEREADALDGRLDLNLQGALRIDPGLEEAHVALAGRHFSALVDAETDRNQDAIVRQEALLTIHTEALHPGHAVRKRCATFLKGTGALTLHTREEGAEVILNRYELKNRRLVAVPVRSLGRTPIDRIDLPKGSYLCTLQHPGSASAPQVRYPVHIGRSQHWDGIRPGGSAPFPLWLPRAPAASVSPDLLEAECYIPPGWFLAGGDPEANEPSSRRRLWVDGFILHRFAVTNRNYIAFLNDLVLQGREEDAVRFSPQMNAAVLGEVGVLLYARTASGGFDVTVDADGDSWDLDWPVLSINWGQSYAYCQWLALKMRRPFRLPGEFEWEKAARGVDGRKFPWGDTHDPSFCWMRESSSEQPLPQMVGLSKADESPFGLMEMAGNMRTWCLDTLEGSGPNTAGDLVLPPEAGDVSPRPLGDFRGRAYRRTRGGAWPLSEQESRCASRHREEALVRNPFNGVRVARPAPED